jgi:Zn-dependent M28 family amino/carboxypeptidase
VDKLFILKARIY